MDWLLDGPPFVEYRSRVDLYGQSEDDHDVIPARNKMLADPKVAALISELAEWPGKIVNSHKSAGQFYHKLNFLADIGVKATDKGMRTVVEKVMEHQSVDGPFQLPMVIGEHYGGSGKETWAWALCDAPLLLYALSKLGMVEDPRVIKGVEYLVTLGKNNGWPCTVSPELGTFRGPGSKNDPCPYATLAMLKMMSIQPQWKTVPQVKDGLEAILRAWEYRQERHPYMFFMGTDFSKLKAPLVWYDLLHVLDVLSNFPEIFNDDRFLSMVEVLKSKANNEGKYIPESIWTSWKGWEFCQKKEPSYWITFLAQRILSKFDHREIRVNPDK